MKKKIAPNKEHTFKLLQFLRDEILSAGGDGDAVWFTKLFELDDIALLLKEFTALHAKEWIVTEESNDYGRYLTWGVDQEWAIITDSEAIFKSQPDWYQMKIQY